MAKDSGKTQRKLDPLAEGYPTPRKALHAIADETDSIDGQPEHLEIHFLASGECTWRMHIRGQEETVGNVLMLDTSG